MNLHIPISIWQKLRLYAELSLPNEVTGIGTISVLDPNNLLVTETFLPRQETSPGFCEFADGELNQIIHDLIERDPESGASRLRFRWHSHGLGGVFWSPHDESDIESWEASWVVNLVMNVYGECLTRLDCFEPLRIREHPIKLCIDYPEDPALRAACSQELREKLFAMSAAKRTYRKEDPADGLL